MNKIQLPAFRARDKQAGAILVLALILLLVMSLVGISANRDVILQERMTGNELDSAVALQAAEAALRAGENQLGNCAPVETLYYGGQDGLYDISANPAGDWELLADEADGSDSWLASNLAQTAQSPRFYIERLEPIALTGDQDLKLGEPVQSAVLFRITAQGFGSSTKTESVVRTIRYTYEC